MQISMSGSGLFSGSVTVFGVSPCPGLPLLTLSKLTQYLGPRLLFLRRITLELFDRAHVQVVVRIPFLDRTLEVITASPT